MAAVRRGSVAMPGSRRYAPAAGRALRTKKALRRLGAYLLLTLLALLTIFPLAWILLTSVKSADDVFSGSLLPGSVSFSSYNEVWVATDFAHHFLNSIFVTVMTMVIVVTSATLAGYAFARFEFRARDWLFYIFLGALIIPGQVILIPMFTFLKQLALLDTLPGLSLSYLGGSLPFAIFLLRAFFKGLPNELGDAGRIDGCDDLAVFLRIYLPLARPGLATVMIFQFVNTWNEFLFATTFISSPDTKTLQSALYLVVGRYSTDWPHLSAALVMAITPIMIVYLALQRQFVKGLTAGAIKG